MRRRLVLGAIALSGLTSAAAASTALLTARSQVEGPWLAVLTLVAIAILGGAVAIGGSTVLLAKALRDVLRTLRSTRESTRVQFHRVRRIDERLRETMYGVRRTEKAFRDMDIARRSAGDLEVILDTRVAELLAGMQAINSQQAELRRAFATEILEEVLTLQERTEADYRQIEALLAIYNSIGVRAPLPSFRDWAISPDCGSYLVATLLRTRPRLVVETGSGVSTLLMGNALEHLGEGRLVSLEHDHDTAIAIRSAVGVHGLEGRVEVREAPLSETEVDGATYQWYEAASIGDIRDIDVLFVDGPPLSSAPMARYPALPLFYQKLTAGAVVLVDDAYHRESRAVFERWRKEFPQFTMRLVEHEKGTAEFTLSKP